MDIQCATKQVQQIQNVNDEYLMDIIKEHIPSSKWRTINNCRMYLRIITISDITDPGGNIMRLDIIEGIGSNNSRMMWPIIMKPSQEEWKMWKWELRKTIL